MHRPARSAPAATKRVALVHHNALLREGLCRILDSGGFAVVWHGGEGSRVAEEAAACSPDVILLEWEAPGVDAALLERLSASSLDSPVVIVTRPGAENDLASGLEAGAAGCLSVNLSAPDFLTALRMLGRGDMVISHELVTAATSTDSEGAQAHHRLTLRELEVLRALGHGASNKEIAATLYISPHTVKIHVHRLLAKMGLRNRQQAAAYAAAEGLL